MFGRILFGLIGTPVGILMVIYAHQIVDRYTGPLDFAENWFGSWGAGTYSFFRLFGLAIAIVSMMVMTGLGGFIYEAVTGSLKGMSSGFVE